MSDIGIPNFMTTQAQAANLQPTAEKSLRRTESQTLKREDTSSSKKPKAFGELVERAPAATDTKSSDASSDNLSPNDRNPKRLVGDDSLKPISLDRSRRADDDAEMRDDPLNSSELKNESSKKSEKSAPENKKTKALKDFMAQMQNHFGIKPEQILQAFSKLSAQELMASPQDVTAQVLKNLNLSEDQKPLAALMYQQMLAQTADLKAQPMAPSFFGPPAAQAGPAGAESKVESVKSELMTKLEALKNQVAPDEAGDTAVGDQTKSDKLTALQKLVAEMKQASPNVDTKELEASIQKLQSKTAAPGAMAATASLKTEATDSASEARLSSLTAMMGAVVAQPQAAKADGAQATQVTANTDAAASMMPTLAALMSKFAGGEKNSSGEQGKGQKDMKAFDALQGKTATDKASAGDVFAALTQQATAGSTAASVSGSGQPQGGQPVSAGDLAATINEIISKSQVLVKKGGGEMKIEMKSESMGQMNMKVSVENGQVSVSMLAHDDRSKKAIEDNMHELKAALVSHKLDIGDIKVALSEGAHKHMDQNQTDHQREQSREAASQFLGNMHDEREQNRSGFFDQPGFKSYRQDPMSRPSMGPAKEVAANALNAIRQTRSMGRAGNSGRLSMVA
jgi:flagellar hook-length control protein FliK